MLSADWVIRTVPSDVWRYTFGLVYEDFNRIPYLRAVDVIKLSHVCSSWKGIVSSAPELWRYVDVSIVVSSQHIRPRTELLSLILRNAREIPLTMVLVAYGTLGTDSALIVEAGKLFFRAAKHAKHLALDIHKDFPFAEIEPEIQASTVLQSLRIRQLPYHDANVMSIVSKVWNPAPSLRSFTWSLNDRMSLRYIKILHLPLQQLTFLDATWEVDADTFRYLMSSMPLLDTAKLYGVVDRLDGETIEDIELPRLRELTLKISEIPSSTSKQLLEFMVLPSLKSLHLIDYDPWFTSIFQTFLAKSKARIEHLSLDIVGTTDETKIECLKLLPFLRTLTLRTESDSNADREIGWVFCADMQEWDSLTQTFVVCPKLEKLVIGYELLCDPRTTVFADMVEERWRRSLAAGKSFEVELRNIDLYDEIHNGEEKMQLLSEVIRILVLKKSGMKVVVDPISWLVKLFQVD
ncbi:hypothetical protein CVT26_008715 [Gymnopilus dilepis]|uniref:F-box domain-containing protein n=1 Tax=Gymnopilus dilepis TaxID=231916 RepID=A0A409YG75_9AGAR|nr:hypothetical protein CVT26_008715 [Gymnopilus dilepis]